MYIEQKLVLLREKYGTDHLRPASVSCAFDAATPDVGDITCSFTASGSADHSIVSDVYAARDCTGSAPNGVVQDPSPTFTFVSGDGTTQETCTYSETVSRKLAQVRILREF